MNNVNFIDPMGERVNLMMISPEDAQKYYVQLVMSGDTHDQAIEKMHDCEYLIGERGDTFELAMGLTAMTGKFAKGMETVTETVYSYSPAADVTDFSAAVSGYDVLGEKGSEKLAAWQRPLYLIGAVIPKVSGRNLVNVIKKFPRKLKKIIKNSAKLATINDFSDEVILGKFSRTGLSYTKIAEARKSTYFNLENWNAVSKKIGKKKMWEINKLFLEQQIAKGKNFLLTHDPAEATGYFLEEVNFLKTKGYTFIKDGEFWKAVK
jgi:hypothetical protein